MRVECNAIPRELPLSPFGKNPVTLCIPTLELPFGNSRCRLTRRLPLPALSDVVSGSGVVRAAAPGRCWPAERTQHHHSD